jgi:acetoacetyl-CoA synthetase
MALDSDLADVSSWMPAESLRSSSLMASYVDWLHRSKGLDFDGYHELWTWSTTATEDFWASLWEFFDVRAHTPYDTVLADSSMPGAQWFPGSTLNYAEHALRHDLATPAVVELAEGRDPVETGWDELRGQVGALAQWLTRHGVSQGDRVVGYLPSTAPSVVAFLACATIGAVWSACSQEYSPQGAADRFEQLSPVVLVAADGYRYAGREHGRHDEVVELRRLLPTVREVLWVDNLTIGDLPNRTQRFSEVIAGAREPRFVAVPFDHPLWVLYSSGTTGRPKGIIHGHGGILLEHEKYLGLHVNLHEGSRFFWFSTTSWMMWNIQVSGLLRGATIFLYDGSPAWPGPGSLWQSAAEQQLDVLGTSAAHLIATQKAGVQLGRDFDLSSLRALGCTGSPLPPSCAEWVHESLPDVWLCAGSGGTDIASGFCGGVPILPVRATEMQARLLGVAMEAWDADGNALVDEVGELVVTRPMPSMPLGFWSDPEDARYLDAYFAIYPGVWRHGDWVTVTSTGGVQVHGRSDATMNRFGVRIGSAEIYEALGQLPEIADSLVVGIEQPDGGYWMPLFVVRTNPANTSMDDASLAEHIRRVLRTQVSPRHVPDDVIVVPALPRTLTGKRLEIPVKRILQGAAVEDATNTRSVDDPAALQLFANLAQQRSSPA